MPQTWTTFTREDLTSLVDAVHALAASGDAGVNGHGTELVIESPPLRWWQRTFRRRQRDQARIAITDSGGRAGYPVHIRLFTTRGASAAHQVERRPGWVTSNTAGQAVLMMKAKAATNGAYDATELITGTVAALADLHLRSPRRGWRYRVHRAVVRI